MNRLPPEILHAICELLPRADVPSIRLVNKKLSLIGLYYLISRVSFFLSKESLQRLHDISIHPILCQQVRTLHYQANVLKDIKNIAVYKDIMNTDVHRHDRRPQSPGPDASERERRLYLRNEAKWRRGDSELVSSRQIRNMMCSYSKICTQQTDDIRNHVDRDLLATAVTRFPNLKNMTFTARPTCCHGFGQRFMERFKDLRITPPTRPDTGPTVKFLSNYLNPLAGTNVKLDSLFISHVSPEILRMPKLNKQIESLKSNLASITDCTLSFKLDAEKTSRLHDEGADATFAVMKHGGLPLLLSHMPRLRHLLISFDDCPCQTKIPLDRILGDHEWPNLRSLTLAQFSTTDEKLMDTLIERMPCLWKLSFSNVTLTEGSWMEVTANMKKYLSLEEAVLSEILRSEEFAEYWDMRNVNMEALGYDAFITLGDDLNRWICEGIDTDEMEDEDIEDEMMDFNPLMDAEIYADPQDLDEEELPPFLFGGPF